MLMKCSAQRRVAPELQKILVFQFGVLDFGEYFLYVLDFQEKILEIRY